MKYVTTDGTPIKLTMYQNLQTLGITTPYMIWYRTPQMKDDLAKFKTFSSARETIAWITKNSPKICITTAVVAGLLKLSKK